MHLPWTQVANEVIDQAAPQLASALEWHEDMEVGEALALRGLLCFIRWALGRCPTDRPPSQSALVPGPGAARLIALQMRYRGDPQALVDAMAAVRPSPIITVGPEGVRVNGLDRYDQAWRKNFKDEAKVWDERAKPRPAPAPTAQPAFRADSGRKADVDRADSGRQTQTQSLSASQKDPSRAGARAEPGEADRLTSAPVGELLERVEATHLRIRGRALEWGSERMRVAVERALGDLAAKHGVAEVVRRLENALTYPVGKFPYFAEAGDLVKHWSRYAEPHPDTTGPPARGAAPAQGPRRPRTQAEADQLDAEERAEAERERRRREAIAQVAELERQERERQLEEGAA